MKVNSFELQLEAPLDAMPDLKPISASAWLPYAALLITVAAFNWNAPAKLASLVKAAPPAPAEDTTDIVPTSVNYPVPAQSIWIERPGSDGSLLAHR